jgi:nucleotide-binding universal stress UspA family protein
MATKKSILVLTDFSQRADRAAQLALQLAIGSNADLLLYNSVIRPETVTMPPTQLTNAIPVEDIEEKRKLSIAKLIQLSDQLKATLTPTQQSQITINYKDGMGSVTETILNLVAVNDIWIVVMGNRVNKELTSAFFDSNVPSVINNCGCPVLLVP